MAVNVESVTLLLFSLLDIPWVLCLSSALCPHTTFYHGCWIRRFPGLFLSFSGSEQRGAKVLQRHPEPSAQLCSRKCCHQELCNLAVFYFEMNNESGECHLVHCPQPESCLLQLQERSILYTVMAGADPDLLVFDKLGHIDLNPRSSLKWERLNLSRVPTSSTPVSPTILPSNEPHVNSLSTHPHDELPLHPPTQHPSPQPPSPADSPLRSLPPTYSPPLTAQVTSKTTLISSPEDRESNKETPPSLPPLDQPDLQSPAHLDSSKQHINETKGHSGRNQTYEGDTEDSSDTMTHLWPLPALIGSMVTLLCCCSGILAFGCCRRKRRGRYRPWRAPRAEKGTMITCTLLKEKA
ncbi:MANSC domain-containing protein 4 isoform X1 [Bufo bufo]|uniref:MANSC domain-containing protein 4 isoform X1 n=1 Tax=Bufo bufo TaxID=8384 RepID=UPI001ABE3772|nr:MANSC domain-containing protein 4 isoform X1 [Bufo bufo]